MEWIFKLIWKFKSDKQILIAKEDAEYWMKDTYIPSMTAKATDRWNHYIYPELQRRKLI